MQRKVRYRTMDSMVVMNAPFLFIDGDLDIIPPSQTSSHSPCQGITEPQCVFLHFHQLTLLDWSHFTGTPHGTVDWCCAFDGCNLALWCCPLPRSHSAAIEMARLQNTEYQSPMQKATAAPAILAASRPWSNPWLHMGRTSPQRAIQRHRTFGRTWHNPAFTDLWARQDRIMWIIACHSMPQFLVTKNLNSSQILFCIEMLKEFALSWSPGCLLSLTNFMDSCLSSIWQILRIRSSMGQLGLVMSSWSASSWVTEWRRVPKSQASRVRSGVLTSRFRPHHVEVSICVWLISDIRHATLHELGISHWVQDRLW